jgi:hypothetical protein
MENYFINLLEYCLIYKKLTNKTGTKGHNSYLNIKMEVYPNSSYFPSELHRVPIINKEIFAAPTLRQR